MSGPAAPRAAREALARALDEVAPELVGLVEDLRDVLPVAGEQPPDERQTGQFLRALVALMHEGLEGETDEKRSFVLGTAVPALVAQGRRPLDLVESNVAFFTLMGHRLLQAVPAELRGAAGLWLGAFFGGLLRDVTAAALAATAAEGP